MANTILRVAIPDSGTFTLKLYALNGDTLLNGTGDSITRGTNNKSHGDAIIAEALTGVHEYRVTDASDNTIVTGVTESLADDTASYRGYDFNGGLQALITASVGGGLSTANMTTIIAGVQAVSEDIASPLSANQINVTEGDHWIINITGLGSLANRTNMIWAMKFNRVDKDSESVIYVDETTGLITVAGTPYATAANGSLTITDESAGDIQVVIASVVTKKIRQGQYKDGAKILRSVANGGDLTYRPKGEVKVSTGPVDAAT